MNNTLTASALACAAALSVGLPYAPAANFQSLIDRSPFAPPGQINLGSDAPAEQGVLEFRGVVTDSDGVHYSVFDTTANKGHWLTATTTDKPFKVRSYDAATNTLEIEQGGKTVKLALKRAVIQAGQAVSAMIPSPAPTPANLGQGGNRPNNNANTANNPEATARRLEAVAAEVRRRRALRNAATPGQPAAEAAPAAPAPATSAP